MRSLPAALLLTACLVACGGAPEPGAVSDWPGTLPAPAQVLRLPGYGRPGTLAYAGPERDLEITFLSAGDAPEPAAAAAERLEAMRAAAREVEVLRDEALADDRGHLLAVAVRERAGSRNLGLAFLDVDPGTRVELNYATSLRPERMLRELGSVAGSLTGTGGAPPADGERRPLPIGSVVLPAALTRRSAFSIRDPDRGTLWELDATTLDPDSGTAPRPLAVPEDTEGPMHERTEETGLPGGTLTLWTVRDPELGGVRERVVRADLLLHGNVRVTLRGTGPEAQAEALRGEVDTLLERLAPAP